MCQQKPTSRRHLRAARLRAKTLSPWNIGLKLISIPVLTLSVALSIYIRTSPYEPEQALAHLIARSNCDAARWVGLAPAYRGGLGYHARNDGDGDGVACEVDTRFAAAPVVQGIPLTKADPAPNASVRMVGGAKFVKP